MDESLASVIARMILDGIFELRGEAGFVSGADALGDIFRSPQTTVAAVLESPAARRGHQALVSACDFIRRGTDIVASHLYMYGRRAVSPALSRALPTPLHVVRFLGVDEESPRGRRLAQRWRAMAMPQAPDQWISWSSLAGKGLQDTQPITWKLYVCPTRESFRAVFGPSVECFARHRAFQFKIGSGAFALARPDKFVAYFHRRSDLTRCMKALESLLAAHSAQPVPFGAGVSSTGMLAWGVDFSNESKGLDEVSWRWWLCERLARYLCRAGTAPTAKTLAADFALLRLSLDGVRLSTFVPSARLLAEIATTSGRRTWT